MILEMKLPSPGESITEVEIAQWMVADGEYVQRDQIICEIDSEKATLELAAEQSGRIELIAQEGDTVEVGSVVCKIDTSAKGEAKAPVKEVETVEAAAEKPETKEEKVVTQPEPAASSKDASYAKGHASPAAKKMMAEQGVTSVTGTGPGGRVTKSDVIQALSGGKTGTRDIDRQKMSMLRRKLAQRLVAVKNETAMLTTFNEVDMSGIMDLRNRTKAKFLETHGVK
ncbi:MAG: E3 binding domain-containing protein, partial [Flavobacteriales bacterium]|nr:E3 binding domain-containing protein [Flavobacteriales bacterium]